MEEKQGFSWTNLPIYRSLTEYILFMQVPRSFLIWNFGIAAFVLLCFGFDYWLGLAADGPAPLRAGSEPVSGSGARSQACGTTGKNPEEEPWDASGRSSAVPRMIVRRATSRHTRKDRHGRRYHAPAP